MARPQRSLFKLDGQQFFCTWPRSDHWDADEFFAWLDSTWGLVWCRLALEAHRDGAPHVHAAFKLAKRVQTTVCTIFDYNGRHGQYEPLRSPAAAAKYFTKDSFVDYGKVPTTLGAKRSVSELVELAGGREVEYLVACAEARLPFQYAKRFRELSTSDEHTIHEFEADLSREDFRLIATPLPERTSIVVIGPSGIGKTSWAKRVAPKPALWVRHIDVLRSFRPGYHRSVIFDDMEFKHTPRVAQIHLVDEHEEAQIHCRYGYATIPANTVKIFTGNEFMFLNDAAINRRVHLIDLF